MLSRSPLGILTLAAFGSWASCSGGGAGVEPPTGMVGAALTKPGGSTYFLDDHGHGNRSRVRLVGITWGRLVDIHGLDADGRRSAAPYMEEVVVHETLISDGVQFELRRHPASQREQLVILRRTDDPDFLALLAAARANLPGVAPLPEDAATGGPFTLIPRDATLMLQFDDLLADDGEAARRLPQTVHVLTGSPPTRPTTTRILFDPNHGGIARGVFHSTRILIDPTISEFEVSSASVPLTLEPRGFPASRTDVVTASAVVRIPTRSDPHAGQFHLLTNLAGRPLDELANAPVDMETVSREVRRAFRAGNRTDTNNGYLLDVTRPSLVSRWELAIERSRDDPAGTLGVDFLVDLGFKTTCLKTPEPGDALSTGAELLEVIESAGPPDAEGRVAGVRVRLLSGTARAASLAGSALFVTRHDPFLPIHAACWVTFLPPAGKFPNLEVRANTLLRLEFDEPLDPDSLSVFDALRLVRGTSDLPGDPPARRLVVGQVLDAPGLKSFLFRPLVPLSAADGGAYFLDLVSGEQGVRDLSGNELSSSPGRVDLRLDPSEPKSSNLDVVMRFSDPDELLPIGLPDLRGQLALDTVRGVALPRPVVFSSHPVDRGNTIPGLMEPIPTGLQTPLSPLGSRLMTVWRYADLGWRVGDESKYNLDVIGMSWSPLGGVVLNDFFPRFEMRVAHGRKVPDEYGTILHGPLYRFSGIAPSEFPWAINVLGQSEADLTLVHERSLGYRIDSSDLAVNSHGTALMPFPWNRSSGPFTSFTWRDTAEQRLGGNGGGGVPMAVEVRPPVSLEPTVGGFAISGLIPSVGLPLLWEIKTFPTSSGLGLNPLDVSLGHPPRWQFPRFRAFSTGGVDTNGTVVLKDPDLELVPSGGFNPGSNPPGRPTLFAVDPVFYMGQLETVTRVSRSFTAWIDAGAPSTFTQAVLEPRADEQPPGTSVEVSYRAARRFVFSDQVAPFDARALDAYGELLDGNPLFVLDDNRWTEDPSELAGGRYLQLRITLFGDVATGNRPELSSLGLVATQQ